MIGMKQSTASNMPNGGQTTSKFGAIFAGISTKTMEQKSPSGEVVPIELIPNLYNATTFKELESALAGNLSDLDAIETNASLEELANSMSIDPEEVLEQLQLLLQKSGMAKEAIDELTISTNIWSLLNLMDEAGVRLFNNLNDALEKPGARNEATQLLSLLKAIELLAPKNDMVIDMEQKVDSFREMMTNAGRQFEQRIATIGKQEQIPFIHKKNGFRIILETNAATSSNAEGNGQKQSETTSNSGSVHTTTTVVRAELPIQQAESNSTNRSEAFMRDMQALMKRSNFGQVGGTNRMLIKLYPEHLGQIRIELLETNGVMTARILASTAFAKGMLDSQLHQLKHAFNQQNLQVDRIDITQTIQESQKNDREQSFNEQFKREQQTNDNNEKKSSDEEHSFEEYMIELEV